VRSIENSAKEIYCNSTIAGTIIEGSNTIQLCRQQLRQIIEDTHSIKGEARCMQRYQKKGDESKSPKTHPPPLHFTLI